MPESEFEREIRQLRLHGLRLKTDLDLLFRRLEELQIQQRSQDTHAAPTAAFHPPAPAPPSESPHAAEVTLSEPAAAPSHAPPEGLVPRVVADWVQKLQTHPPAEKPAATASPGMELIIGRTLLNRVGAVILLLAVAFFIKYSFDKGWISPTLRVAVGAVVGLGLIAGGELARRRRMEAFCIGIIGAGVVILYFSAYAAHHFYHLVAQGTAFGLFVGVTILSTSVSVHGRLLPVAILSLVGGFWTPLALSTGSNQQVVLLTYLLILDFGFLLSAAMRRWDVLRGLCWIGTAALFGGWAVRYYQPTAMWPTLCFLCGFYVLFHAEVVWSVIRRRIVHGIVGATVIHANNAAFFAAVYFAAHEQLHGWMGVFCVGTASLQFALGRCLSGDGDAVTRARQTLYLDGATMLAFAVPLQFDRWLVSLSWAVQAIATAWFCRRHTEWWLRLKTAGVFTAAIFHLLWFDLADPRLGEAILHVGAWFTNWLILLVLAMGVCAYAAAGLLRLRREAPSFDRALSAQLVAAGCVLMLGIWAKEYDRYLATWHWLALTMLWCLWMNRAPDAAHVVVPLVIACCSKYLGWDLVLAAQTAGWESVHGIALNPPVITGILVCGLTAFASIRLRQLAERIAPQTWEMLGSAKTCQALLDVLAAAVATSTLTFEILRVFRFEPWGQSWDHHSDMGILCVTGAWALNALLVLAMFCPRHFALTTYACLLLGVAMLKLTFVDTLGEAASGAWDRLRGVACNRTFAIGLLVIACGLAAAAVLRRAGRTGARPFANAKPFTAMLLATCVLIVWLPTFEIVRVFRFEEFRERFDDPALGMHVALSVYWSGAATTFLIIGFARRLAPLRYVAIALFGLTVLKVFLVDLSHLETIYRIISFFVLGVLLLLASLLYQKLSARISTPAAP